jgi:hypothetical protein
MVILYSLVFILILSQTCLTKISGKDFEHKIWHLTNGEREKLRLAPLKYDEGLADLSRLHSENMLQYNFFAHKDQLGDQVGDRQKKYYPCLLVSSIGENLAFHQNSTLTFSPEDVVDGWMNSSGHRANILSKDFTYIGVGIIISDDKLYSTQNFATPIVKRISKLQDLYDHQSSVKLVFEYMSPIPKKDLCCFLSFPDPKFRYQLNPREYAIGCKPITIDWLSPNTLEIKIDFPAGTGMYELQFGFDQAFYQHGVRIQVS